MSLSGFPMTMGHLSQKQRDQSSRAPVGGCAITVCVAVADPQQSTVTEKQTNLKLQALVEAMALQHFYSGFLCCFA
jgi:hypothetical protein